MPKNGRRAHQASIQPEKAIKSRFTNTPTSKWCCSSVYVLILIRSLKTGFAHLTYFFRSLLVGPNMGGKSNLLDLFRFINECWFPLPAMSGVGGALARRQGIDEVLWKGGPDRLLAIGFEFVEGPVEYAG